MPAKRARGSASSPRKCGSSRPRPRAPPAPPATRCSRCSLGCSTARERLIRLGKGGMAAKDAAHAAVEGLINVAADAEANDEWTRRISASAGEVRGLIEGIAGRMREVSAGTEDYAAAAAGDRRRGRAAQRLDRGDLRASPRRRGERLTGAVGGFDRWAVTAAARRRGTLCDAKGAWSAPAPLARSAPPTPRSASIVPQPCYFSNAELYDPAPRGRAAPPRRRRDDRVDRPRSPGSPIGRSRCARTISRAGASSPD